MISGETLKPTAQLFHGLFKYVKALVIVGQFTVEVSTAHQFAINSLLNTIQALTGVPDGILQVQL